MQIKTITTVLCLLISSIGLTEIKSYKSNQSNDNSNRGTGFEIKKFTLSSGGGVITAGNYNVISSIGQVDAGPKLSGGNFEFRGGFLTGNSGTGNPDVIFENSFEQ
ncbi:MAG: hypothetical protein AB8B80_09130 [Marinicellaceae bacterium]